MASHAPRRLALLPARPARRRLRSASRKAPLSTCAGSRSSSHLLLLPEEEALLKELKDDKDRREFQQIFWARRDPTPGSPANELEDNVRAVWKHADELFSYPNQKGSETGCGQVLALLGRPEEVRGKGDEVRTPRRRSAAGVDVSSPAPGPGRPFDNMAYLREGSTREPETWVYRDRPGLPYTFTRRRAAHRSATPSAGSRRAASSPRTCVAPRRPW